MSFNLSSAPFSSDSLWNQQVPTGATYTPLNWPTSTGWNYAVGWSNVPVYVASSSDPVVQVSVPASWGWPGGTVSVHVPAGATGGSGTDAPAVIIDGDTVYNFWRFNRTSNTTATAQAYGEANVVTGTGWGSPGLGAGIVAAGASELGGLLVQAQTDTGTIDHALQLAVDNTLLAPGYVAPAIASDGHTVGAPLQEGQLLAIPPGTPMPSGLSPLGQEVFRALQQYGAYVIDNGGTGQTAIRAQANAYDAATMDALRLDLNSVLRLLGAVSGGSPTSPTPPAVQPAVTQASASPATGIEHAGDAITLTLAFNEAVTVSGTPTLSLNDGNTATYVSGSGTNALTFRTTVASTDTNTSALAITGVNLASGANIKDASGVAANLSGAVHTFSGLQIDPVLPAVTQATASPATGTELVGDTITLTLGFNEAVTVTGTPTLSLNDGDTATYVSGSGTNALTFRTTVASTDTNTSALAITGVNLASGASIKDASGVAANLSAAVTTFSGLQVSTSSTSPSTPSTPSSVAPVLTVADSTLSVTGRGGTVDLGVNVTTTDPNDVVTVNITGLPNYESITDKLDGQTFTGKNITLTAAQVDSGLTLTSNYKGAAHPVATLTLTANANDPSTGAITTSAPHTITVTDPRPATTATTTSPQTISVTNPTPATGTTAGFLANQGFALLQQHLDPITSAVATSAPPTITVTDHPPATGTTTASLASQSFALLNQYLAGNSGRVDPGQIVAAVSQGAGWGQESFLTRPQH
jgi:hypothetical protein